MSVYHAYGKGREVLVVMPGGPGVNWDSLRMPLVEQHMTVVYIEPIGTGGADRLPSHPYGYTRDVLAAEIDSVIDALGHDRVWLLGHSYGAFVAQYYASLHPAKIKGLFLYESSPVTGDEQGTEALRMVQEFAARNAGNPELPAVLDALGTVGFVTDDDKLTATLRALLPAYFADFWGHEERYRPLRDSVSVTYIADPDPVQDRELLAALTVPTLVIAGRYDVICGPRWAEEIHSLVAGSRLVILENSGHLGHLEEPSRFAGAVTSFATGATGVL